MARSDRPDRGTPPATRRDAEATRRKPDPVAVLTMAQLADLVWREQQGLLHTLHDSLGQTLTGLGMLSAGLRRQVADTNPAAGQTAGQVAQQAQVALDQVRQLARTVRCFRARRE